jgi:hypothetical protein
MFKCVGAVSEDKWERTRTQNDYKSRLGKKVNHVYRKESEKEDKSKIRSMACERKDNIT